MIISLVWLIAEVIPNHSKRANVIIRGLQRETHKQRAMSIKTHSLHRSVRECVSLSVFQCFNIEMMVSASPVQANKVLCSARLTLNTHTHTQSLFRKDHKGKNSPHTRWAGMNWLPCPLS